MKSTSLILFYMLLVLLPSSASSEGSGLPSQLSGSQGIYISSEALADFQRRINIDKQQVQPLSNTWNKQHVQPDSRTWDLGRVVQSSNNSCSVPEWVGEQMKKMRGAIVLKIKDDQDELEAFIKNEPLTCERKKFKYLALVILEMIGG